MTDANNGDWKTIMAWGFFVLCLGIGIGSCAGIDAYLSHAGQAKTIVQEAK